MAMQKWPLDKAAAYAREHIVFERPIEQCPPSPWRMWLTQDLYLVGRSDQCERDAALVSEALFVPHEARDRVPAVAALLAKG